MKFNNWNSTTGVRVGLSRAPGQNQIVKSDIAERGGARGSQPFPAESTRLMDPAYLIELELVAAERAWKDANDGKARVCARRAVALASEAWLTRRPVGPWRGDAMAHLRRIQQDVSLPLPVREAAERLTTTVTGRDSAPFTTDPVGDARVIIAYLTANSEEKT